MAMKGSVLDDLRMWVEVHESSLASRGCIVEFAESPSSQDKRSAWMTITTPPRIGRLVIWDTGEAELSTADAVSGDITEDHREITSEIGLLDAVETLLVWVSESG